VEDVLRPVGFVAIVFGFVLAALGVASSLHAVPPAQFPDRWLELTGGFFMLAGIGLTAIAGRSGEPFLIQATTRTSPPPDGELSINVTTSTKTIGAPPRMLSSLLSKLVDASSKDMIAGMLADLDDPSKASTIHIEGADPAQVKEELRRLLSPDTSGGSDDKAGAGGAEPPPDASLDLRSSQLRELDNLHATGVLNDEQYDAARAKLLG
jgi:hypothetical protein